MQIDDLPRAAAYLERIGYYRLSAYWYPFREIKKPLTAPPSRLDVFVKGANFGTVVDLYVFDKRLRLLLMDALERIEISLRTQIALAMGALDPWAHRDPALLDAKFSRRGNPPEHQEWMARIDSEFQKSKEDFVQHFKTKYPKDNLPIWIACELWDFGTMSFFFKNGMRGSEKKRVAKSYGISNESKFSTWIWCLNNLRNICAHHARLWNRPLVVRPPLQAVGQIQAFDHIRNDAHALNRLYTALLFLDFLMSSINPHSTWKARLIQHLKTFPKDKNVDLASAGFPNGWECQPVWR